MTSFYHKPLRAAFLLLFLNFLAQSVKAQPVLAYTTVASGLTKPVDLVPEPGTNRLFIVEHTGNIRIIDNGDLLATSFLNLSGSISNVGEQGLLSLAFHPDYVNNHYFFVYYTNNSNQIEVARYQRSANDPNIADASSGRVLLNITKQAENHNGGKLNFGPDGMLYFATGDGLVFCLAEESLFDAGVIARVKLVEADGFASRSAE